jgi:O-antigen ligase
MTIRKLIFWFAALNILLLLAAPQLNTAHYDPLPEFWGETSFAWLGISLFLIVCFYFKSLSLPSITLPLILFACALLIQPFVVHIDFVGLSYVAAFEMILCILIAIAISTLITEYGREQILLIICYSLLIGAILQSLLGLIQYLNLLKFFPWVFYDSAHPNSDIFGHFGQRNHYCHYLSWGIFGLIYLYIKDKIKLHFFIILLIWLIFSMTIASSRSVFLYFALATIISGIFYLKNNNPIFKKLFFTILCTSIFLVAFEYLYPLIHQLISHHNQSDSGLQRLTSDLADNSLTGRRLVEWKKALIVFKSHPLFGVGWNEYAKQSVYLQLLFPNAPANSGLFTNCHNIILQLMAETGMIGTAIFVLGLLIILTPMFRINNAENVILLCLVFTSLAHNMVEYPFWYIYFFGPFIIYLSFNQPLYRINSNTMAAIALIPIVAMVYLMFYGSYIYNTVSTYSDAPSNYNDYKIEAGYLKQLVDTNVLWSYPALYNLDNYLNIDEPNTNKFFTSSQQEYYINLLTNFHPYPDDIIKQAILDWNHGQYNEAKTKIDLALVAFPVYKNSFLTDLKNPKYATMRKMVKDYK